MKQIPFAARWTIKEKDLKALTDIDKNECLQSKYISTTASGLKYLLQIFPNGHCAERRGNVYIYLEVELGNLREVVAEYTIRINNVSNELEDTFDNKAGAWGIHFCNTNELFDPEEKYIINGKMVLEIEGVFIYGKNEDFGNSYNGILGNQLWDKNDRKDFLIITADGKGINAHKCILRSRSPVFAAMFRSKMKEEIENCVEIIDFSFDVIEMALKLIYDRLAVGIDCGFKQSLSVFQFFDKYDFRQAKDTFEKMLIKKMNASNVCRIMNCSLISSALKLQEKCEEFLMAAFASKTPMMDLDILDTDIAQKIFQNYLYHDVKNP